MKYEEKIQALAEQYEGDDKLGILKLVEIDYKQATTKNRDGKLTISKYWQVSLRYTPNARSFRSKRVQTGEALTLKMCFLQLQEYLKLEMQKVEINNRIKLGQTEEDEINEPRNLKNELAKAIAKEQYEKAREIQNEINQNT